MYNKRTATEYSVIIIMSSLYKRSLLNENKAFFARLVKF